MDAHNHLVERGGPDFPAEVGFRAGRRDLPNAEVLVVRVIRGDRPRVEIDADEVVRCPDGLVIPRTDVHLGQRALLVDVGPRVDPRHERPQKPVVRECVLALGGGAVLLRFRIWISRRHAEGCANRLRRPDRPHRPRGGGLR